MQPTSSFHYSSWDDTAKRKSPAAFAVNKFSNRLSKSSVQPIVKFIATEIV